MPNTELSAAEVAFLLANTGKRTTNMMRARQRASGGSFVNMSRTRITRSTSGRTTNHGRTIKFVDQDWADNFAKYLERGK
jgi:hypothetical protein